MNTIHTNYFFKPVVMRKIPEIALILSFLVCGKAIAADPVITTGSAASTVSAGISVSAGNSGEIATDTDVIARIGDVDVTIEEVKTTLKQLDPIKEYEIEQNPVQFQHLVESVALRQRLLKEALSKHWDQQEAVASEIEREKSNTITNSYLLQLTKLADDYPSDKELHERYEATKQSLAVPHQFQIAQIFIAIPESADKLTADEAQKKLEAVVKRLQEPDSDFAQVARSESEDKASAAKGGDMGWMADTKIPGLIRVHAIHLPKNGISDPIRINDGWHIVKLLDSKDVSPVPFDQVKGILVQQLRTQRVQKSIHDYLANLLTQHPVSIDEEVFSKFLNAKK
jgi:parvulin-like peptidyl-prolyl isomerase